MTILYILLFPYHVIISVSLTLFLFSLFTNIACCLLILSISKCFLVYVSTVFIVSLSSSLKSLSLLHAIPLKQEWNWASWYVVHAGSVLSLCNGYWGQVHSVAGTFLISFKSFWRRTTKIYYKTKQFQAPDANNAVKQMRDVPDAECHWANH